MYLPSVKERKKQPIITHTLYSCIRQTPKDYIPTPILKEALQSAQITPLHKRHNEMSIITQTIFIFIFFSFPFQKLNRPKLRWACMHISWSLYCLVAENDFELTWRRALMPQRRTVMCIGKRSRTSVLKELREGRSPTRLWAIIVVPTTQFIGTKSFTPTLTSNNWTVTRR